MELVRKWVYLALFFLYLTAAWALVIFSVQMSKSNRFMISDAFSNALGTTALTQTAIAAAYTFLFAMTVVNVLIILDLEHPFLIFPVLFAELAFTTCLACDANAGAEEVVCHNISCMLGGVAYFIFFVYVFKNISESVSLQDSFEGRTYIKVSVAIPLFCFSLVFGLILTVTLGESSWTSYAIGICEMLLLFFSVLFVSFSVYFAGMQNY